MRLLHLSTPLSWRGGEQQLAYLLDELRQRGVQQHLVCPDGSELAKWCDANAFTCHTVHKGSLYPLSYALHLRTLLGEVDIVHAHDARAHSLALLALLSGLRKPKLVVSRRVDFPVPKSWFSQYKYTNRLLTRSLCVSSCVAQVLGSSVPAIGSVRVVHSGIDLQRFSVNASALSSLRTELKLAPDIKLVAQIAALSDHKDYPTFIACAELMVKQRSDLYFLIIGNGELEAQIRARIEQGSATDKIKMLGFRADLGHILPQLDLLLLSSKSEGLGTTILDAFAARVPVAATRAGGIGEMVEHERTGLLADVGSASQLAQAGLKLLTDPQLAQRLSTAAYAKLEQKFSKQAMAAKTYANYQEILEPSQ